MGFWMSYISYCELLNGKFGIVVVECCVVMFISGGVSFVVLNFIELDMGKGYMIVRYLRSY